MDLDHSTTHHSSLYFRIGGSASSTAAIDMGDWHAEIKEVIAMKLKSAVGVLDPMAEKVAKEQPHAAALKETIHSRSFTRKKADGTTPQAVNAAEARARLLAFAILKTGQNHFPHGILEKSESHHPLMCALPLECEKLLAVMDHQFFNGKRGASARVLLDEQSKMPREAPAAVAAAAPPTEAEEQKALNRRFGF